MGDLLRPYYLTARLAQAIPKVNRTLAHFGSETLDADQLLGQAAGWGEALGVTHRGHPPPGPGSGSLRSGHPA